MLKPNDAISYGLEEDISISFQYFCGKTWKVWGGEGGVLMSSESETQNIFMAHKLKSPSCTSSSAPFFSLKGEGRGKTEEDKKKVFSPLPDKGCKMPTHKWNCLEHFVRAKNKRDISLGEKKKIFI